MTPNPMGKLIAQALDTSEWRIHQDSPEFGCTDNPTHDWFASQYKNGHWTGVSLRASTEGEIMELIEHPHPIPGDIYQSVP